MVELDDTSLLLSVQGRSGHSREEFFKIVLLDNQGGDPLCEVGTLAPCEQVPGIFNGNRLVTSVGGVWNDEGLFCRQAG